MQTRTNVISVADTTASGVRASSESYRNTHRRHEVYGSWGEPAADACGPSLVPAMPMLGWSRWEQTEVRGLGPHRHPTYEVCLIADGQVCWWADGDGPRTLSRGQVWITAPGEMHGGVDTMMHPCELFWLHVDPARLDHSGALSAALAGSGPRAFFASAPLLTGFETLLAEHRAPCALSPLAACAALQTLLVTLARDRANGQVSAPVSPTIQNALDWMQARLIEPFSIEDAARAARLPPSRFHERFLHEVGQTPGEWRTRARIALAEKRLATGTSSITEIALELGFKSSQHFATTFKRYTGYTPGGYRRRTLLV